MSEQTAVVTGGGTGIGKALAHRLADLGMRVVIVGRRQAPLEETASAYPDRIETVVADVSTPQGRRRIASGLGFGQPLHYLIHNAALLRPVSRLENVILSDWRDSMAVNVEGPIFLTQSLLKHMSEGTRVLHISSGASQKAYRGWGAYCVSKAALNMAWRCLDLELSPRGIRVGSVRPGVVDTPMQDQVRAADAEAFPDLPRFVALKEEGRLRQPEETALFLSWLLTEVEPDRFAAQEWDIREEEMHQNAWKP